MQSQIDQLLEITGNQISIQDCEKYLKWAKGDLQIALNYYYRKYEKDQKTQKDNKEQKTVQNNVFHELAQGAKKQKELDVMIKKLKEEYDKPIEEQLKLNIPDLNQLAQSKINYFENDQIAKGKQVTGTVKRSNSSNVTNDAKFSSLQQNNQSKIENQKPKQPTIQFNEQNKLEEKKKKDENKTNKTQINEEKARNEDFQRKKIKSIEAKNDFPQIKLGKRTSFSEQIETMFPIQLGVSTVRGEIVGKQNLSHLQKGDILQLQLEVNKNKQCTSLANFQPVVRIIDGEREVLKQQFINKIGRLHNSYEKLFGILLLRDYISIGATYLSSPQLCQTLSPIYITIQVEYTFNSQVYLNQSAVTNSNSIGEKLEQDDQANLILETSDHFNQLFNLLNLKIIQQTVISLEAKQNIKEAVPNDHSINYVEKKQSDISNPFYKKPQQKPITFFTRELQTTIKPKDSENSIMEAQDNCTQEQQQTADIDYDKLLNLNTCQIDEINPSIPPETFTDELYHYQRQALTWLQMREGALQEKNNDDDYHKLHPLWREYSYGKEEKLYFNPFSGQISFVLPLSSKGCNGGILADEMGLGKTVMMIALIHANLCDQKDRKPSFEKSKNSLRPGSIQTGVKLKFAQTLIIVPVSLLSQWEDEIKSKSTDNSLSVLIYYGKERSHSQLGNYNVVITTYGTIRSNYDALQKNKSGDATLYAYDWFRIILDEAHYIKGRIIQQAQAVYALSGQHRWCLTGTPLQNNFNDLFSLIHFIRLEPWSDYLWWNKYINKPFEQGNKNVFQMLQLIIKPILLRRTKQSKNKDGTLIVYLPEKKVNYVYLDFDESEQQIYTHIETKSQQEIEGFLQKNILMSRYLDIFEIILRLRQICDHIFLLKSRSAVKNIEQLEETIDQFLQSRRKLEQDESEDNYEIIMDGDKEIRVKVNQKRKDIEKMQGYKEELLRQIRSEELGNCPVCLEKLEDTMITPCLHVVCRLCMYGILKNSSACPNCRLFLTKEDFLTVPREDAFSFDWKVNYRPSTKIKKIVELVNEILQTDDKVVIFSQFLGMMDFIQFDLQRQGIKSLRFDGKLNEGQRKQTLKQFNDDERYQILIISLKTGGVGLNLTRANHVILIDPWWNPAVEEQAIERIHRIGQKKNVNVYRLIIRNSIEQRMLEMHKIKKDLFEQTIIQTSEQKKSFQIQLMTNLIIGSK